MREGSGHDMKAIDWQVAPDWVTDAGTIGFAVTLVAARDARWIDPVWVTALGAIIAILFCRAFGRRTMLYVVPAVFWAAFGVRVSTEASLSLTSLVAPTEAALLALTYCARTLIAGMLCSVRRIAGGAMLMLFGSIHGLKAHDIAALVPSWIPLRTAVPYATGVLQLMLGGLLVAYRTIAWRIALAVAALFGSWLLLVHPGRLLADPSLFEWQFALMAVCLVGALLEAGRDTTISRSFRFGEIDRSCS